MDDQERMAKEIPAHQFNQATRKGPIFAQKEAADVIKVIKKNKK